MKNYHANGWQDFSVKKYVEKIARNTAHTKIINTGIIVDFLLLLVGIIIEQSIPVTEIEKKIYILILIIIAILSLSSVWVVQLFDYIKNKSTRVQHRIRRCVDSFDNEICYYVMMSKSFQDLLNNCNDNEDKNMRIFYYTEMCFYRNKTIVELYKMIQILNLVFEINPGKVRSQKKISVFRLENIIKMVNEINDSIKLLEEIISSYHYKDVLIEENNDRMDNFNQLNAEIKKQFSISAYD